MQYRYRLDPPEHLTETLLHRVDTCRQLYNHILYELIQETIPDFKE